MMKLQPAHGCVGCRGTAEWTRGGGGAEQCAVPDETGRCWAQAVDIVHSLVILTAPFLGGEVRVS